jgi:hypothetical protein
VPTQHTDIYNPTAPAINYTKSGQTWTIASGALVGSGSAPAVYSGFNGSKLVNKGDVFSSTQAGVFFATQKNGTVINKANGSIFGGYGVFVGGPGAKNMTVMNDGSIIGFAQAGVIATDVSNFDLTNTGHIFGAIYGVFASVGTVGATDGPMIENSGVISGGAIGVLTSILSGLKATVVNKSGGTIKGDTIAIGTSAGSLLVDNHGKIKGDIVSEAPNAHDKVVNDGQIKGDVFLGSGDDTFKNAGGTAGKVHGGDGNDTLIAGLHKDQFVFDTTLNAATNVDRVKHFDPGTDKLILDQSYFGALSGPGNLASGEFHKGAAAHDGDDHIIYNKHTGALFYDPDGTGGSPQVEFAKLDKGLNLHASDFVVIA